MKCCREFSLGLSDYKKDKLLVDCEAMIMELNRTLF